MGQRIQVVLDIITKNERKVIVYHNQWLYGFGFLSWAKRFIYGLAYFKKEGYLIDLAIDYAIGYANHSDIEHQTNTHRYDDENHTLILKKTDSAMSFLKIWDNNNGYLYFKINDWEDKIEYDILSGLEDADEVKSVSPLEYIKLFYNDEKINQEDDFSGVLEFLKSQKQCDCIKNLEEFRKELNK